MTDQTPATVSYPVHEPHCNDQCVHYLETDQAAGTRKSPDGLHGDSREGGQLPQPKKEHVNDSTGADPQTPATEAGRGSGTTTECPQVGVHDHPFRGPHTFTEWYDGEAEARADDKTTWSEAYHKGYTYGRADALREAADRVRALNAWHDLRTADLLAFRAAVLTILAETE
jgi:hypothetical protein